MKGCRSITQSEIEAVSKELGIRDRAIFQLGIRTGFRISELLSLNLVDVLDANNVIRETVKVSKRNTKGQTASRTMPIHEAAKAALELYIRATGELYSTRVKNLNNGISPLFISSRGNRMDRVVYHRNLKNALKRAGIESGIGILGTHSLRKTFATEFHKASGNDLYLTQQALGHSSVVTTIKYLAADNELVADIVRKLK